MSEQEKWRPVPGFPDYSVSDQGRVVSRKGVKPRLLQGTGHVAGYRMIHLWRGSPPERTVRSVHSLVAELFIGPRPDGLEVRHLNGDPADNRVQNLCYGTHAENMQDRLRHGRHHNANKTSCPQGHPYSDDNTYTNPTGGRRCRVCHRASRRAAKARAAFRAAGIEVAA